MFLGNGLQVALLEQGGHARRPASLSHPVLLGLWIPFQIYQTVAFFKKSLSPPLCTACQLQSGAVGIHSFGKPDHGKKEELPSLKESPLNYPQPWHLPHLQLRLYLWDRIFTLTFFPSKCRRGMSFFPGTVLFGRLAMLTCDFYYAVYWEIWILLLPLPNLLVQNE